MRNIDEEKARKMKEWITYLGEIMLITAVSGLIYHIAPEGTMKKHLHFVISLCVLVSLAVPMFSVVTALPEIFEREFEEVKSKENVTNEELTELLITAAQQEVEETLVSYISEVCGIARGNISVQTVLDAEDPSAIEVSEIHVILRGEIQTDIEELRCTLEKMFLGKSQITVKSEP